MNFFLIKRFSSKITSGDWGGASRGFLSHSSSSIASRGSAGTGPFKPCPGTRPISTGFSSFVRLIVICSRTSRVFDKYWFQLCLCSKWRRTSSTDCEYSSTWSCRLRKATDDGPASAPSPVVNRLSSLIGWPFSSSSTKFSFGAKSTSVLSIPPISLFFCPIEGAKPITRTGISLSPWTLAMMTPWCSPN